MAPVAILCSPSEVNRIDLPLSGTPSSEILPLTGSRSLRGPQPLNTDTVITVSSHHRLGIQIWSVETPASAALNDCDCRCQLYRPCAKLGVLGGWPCSPNDRRCLAR